MRTNELHFFKLKKPLTEILAYNCSISKVFCGYVENFNYESNQIIIRINSPLCLFVIVPFTDIEYMAPSKLVYGNHTVIENEQKEKKEKEGR